MQVETLYSHLCIKEERWALFKSQLHPLIIHIIKCFLLGTRPTGSFSYFWFNSLGYFFVCLLQQNDSVIQIITELLKIFSPLNFPDWVNWKGFIIVVLVVVLVMAVVVFNNLKLCTCVFTSNTLRFHANLKKNSLFMLCVKHINTQ